MQGSLQKIHQYPKRSHFHAKVLSLMSLVLFVHLVALAIHLYISILRLSLISSEFVIQFCRLIHQVVNVLHLIRCPSNHSPPKVSLLSSAVCPWILGILQGLQFVQVEDAQVLLY